MVSNTKTKDTLLGPLPIDWDVKKIEEVCDILDSQRVPLNKEQRDAMQGEIPYYGANGVVDYINEYLFDEPLILMAEDGGYFDEYQTRPIAYKIQGKSWVNNHAHVLRPKENTDFDWVFYSLVHKNVIPFINGGTRAKLNQSDLLILPIAIPPLAEQRKIAVILSSVDKAIEKTEEIIEQTEKVKKGLMQQLYTKGIGHTKFKNTEIGEIPEEWEVLAVKDVANTTSGGTPSRNNPEYFNGSIPWIKTGELKEKYIYDTEEKITEEAVKNSSAKLVPKNSVIVAMYGATIGKVSINKIDATTNQACCVVIPQKERLNYEFLYYLLTFWKEKLIKLGAGGAQPNISQQIIKNLLIPMPSLKEQMEIANILATLDKKIQNEKKKFDSLSNLKKGLMQVLLTGKVRVKVDDEVMSQ
jgi:type I restriction enzyme, S subunit